MTGPARPSALKDTAFPDLPSELEKLVERAEEDYQDAVRTLLLQLIDLQKLYLEDRGNYQMLQNSAVAALKKFPGLEAAGVAEKIMYVLVQSLRANPVHLEYASEMAKSFHTIVTSERLGHKSTYPPGTLLIRQGERSSMAYLITKGRVRVFTTDRNGQVKELAVLGSIALVGEFRLLYSTPASASVEVLDPVEAVAIEPDEFRIVLQKNTGIRYWVIEEANHRLQPLVASRFGKLWLARLLGYVTSRDALEQFRDELLASFFIMFNALQYAPPRTCAAAMSNVEDIYSKIVNPLHSPRTYTFQAGLAELMSSRPLSLDILWVFNPGMAGLDASTAARIQRTLRFKGVCYLIGTCDSRILRNLQRTGLSHLDMGLDLHAFVKTPPPASNGGPANLKRTMHYH